MAVKLYEITALVTRSVVVAAVSEKDAMAQVADWDLAWDENSDRIGVSDVEILDVRKMNKTTLNHDAHEITDKAQIAMVRGPRPRTR